MGGQQPHQGDRAAQRDGDDEKKQRQGKLFLHVGFSGNAFNHAEILSGSGNLAITDSDFSGSLFRNSAYTPGMPEETTNEPAGSVVTMDYVRHRNALLIRADLSTLFTDYYLHLADNKLRYTPEQDV